MILDKTKIGRLIGIGGEHIVYHYDDSQIIKFPNWVAKKLFNNQKLAEKKQADFLLAKKYFADYLLDTEYIITTQKKQPYYLIQPLVKARSLNSQDLNNLQLKNDFLKICQINEQIIKQEGMAFDFFGAWRLLFYEFLPGHEINNLMVVNDSKIIINDFGFLEFQGCHWSKLLYLISRWAAKRQKKLLKKFINL